MDLNDFQLSFGVVEDRQDPLKLGRVRVRLIGRHSDDLSRIPTASLPWATPMQPLTSAAMGGVGQTPLGPVEGTHVVVMARDDAHQDLVVIGTLGGIPQEVAQEKKGFNDPDQVYPKESHIGEPDTNRLARNESIEKTIVQTKKDERRENIPTALGGTWDQPEIPYNAEYPKNHVRESESGHIEEWDDTPGAERLNRHHRSGTFEEIHSNGDKTIKVIGDEYVIILGQRNIVVDGQINITGNRGAKLFVTGNVDIEVDGDVNLKVTGDVNETIDGDRTSEIAGNLIMNAEGNVKITGKRIDLN